VTSLTESYASLDAGIGPPLVKVSTSLQRFSAVTILNTERSIAQTNSLMSSKNIFDNLPAIQAPRVSDLRDELERFLSTDPEHVEDVFIWWYEHKHVYPCLYRMALDYLTIPGTPSFISVSHICLSLCQPPRLMSNEPSVRGVLSCPMCGADSLSSQHGHFCASESGVQWGMCTIVIFSQLQCCLKLMVKKMSWLMTGMQCS
jgi:hypothetical protein